MCAIDLEACAVWNERVRVARKTHRCVACWATIQHGDAYLYHSSVFDHSARSEKMCALCWMVREEFRQAHEMNCMPSDLIYMLQECVAEDRAPKWRILLAIVLRSRRRNRTH